MNNKHILDLTLRLSQALDQNYDVVSMDTVMAVISALEGTTITKDQLEATRLAKYINQLRRRTKCENLARRAKSLLKRWREMVGIQHSNEPSVTVSSGVNVPFNMPVSDNAVCTSQIKTQFSLQDYQKSRAGSEKLHKPTDSEPPSPVNLEDHSNNEELLTCNTNPATCSDTTKNSTSNIRKKRRFEIESDTKQDFQLQQPTTFTNLITGMSSPLTSSRNTLRDKPENLETFTIEHSSNSNSDLMCIPSNNTVSSNITSVTDVPPVVIDLQDTNSSMNSLISKCVTDAQSSINQNKLFPKKSKKDKKRKERKVDVCQNQPLHECDEQNTITPSYHNRPPEVLSLGEKSNSACPTLSNISEILSLSNSSMSSVLPSTDLMSKNAFQSTQNEFSSSLQLPKSDLTFAGKFKQCTSSSLAGYNNLSYNNDCVNTNIFKNYILDQNQFSLFGATATTSNGSSSNSLSSFQDAANIVKIETSDSIYNIDDVVVKHEINEKSMSTTSYKGYYSTNAITTAMNTTVRNQQSIDLTNIVLSPKPIKPLKKRGRKKGSKGVDSVIAKETSLSSQMLISSISGVGKKVKTTKELYAEMENRKLHNVKIAGLEDIGINFSVNSTDKQQKSARSRPQSVSSDIVESDSCTMTSEPSHDSGNLLSKTSKDEMLVDNNSNYSKQEFNFKISKIKNDECSRFGFDENSISKIISKIKLEIQEVVKLLTPPPNIKQIEYDCLSSVTPCTCKIENVASNADNNFKETSCESSCNEFSKFKVCNSINVTDIENNQLKEQIEQKKNENTIFSFTDIQKEVLIRVPSSKKVKKSIFDLDYDDEEDPLNAIIANIVGSTFNDETKQNTLPMKDDIFATQLITEDGISKLSLQNAPYCLNVPTTLSGNNILSNYEIRNDPDCKAKYRFEIQTQKITKFHVDTLHNLLIPNVNGNWNHADIFCTHNSQYLHKTNVVIDGYSVVPFYGSFMNEYIAKNLSHVKFTEKIKHSKLQNGNDVLFQMPFLGVSHVSAVGNPNSCITDHKNIALKGENENADIKLNANSKNCNIRALDTTNAKDTGYVDTSSNNLKLEANKIPCFNLTKKRATLVEPSLNKRQKFTADVDLDFNASNSDYDTLKLHKVLFYQEELYPVVRNGSRLYKESIFNISSCSSGCSSADENEAKEILNCRPISSSYSDYHKLNFQHPNIAAEIEKITKISRDNDKKTNSDGLLYIPTTENDNEVSKDYLNNSNFNHDKPVGNGGNDLPVENNHMLLSFNHICNKYAELQNDMLNQRLEKCDEYNNLNNFNLIKYIDNKTSYDNNIYNNHNNPCSNNCSDANINIGSSSCNHENPNNSVIIHNHNNNNSDIQIEPFNEYQIGIRAVDEDVNDDDGNYCGHLQRFKEWHEVLQLRSYNDELLTVLPYVVLE